MKTYASIINKIQKSAQYAFHGYSDKYSGPEGSGYDTPVTSPLSPLDRGISQRVFPYELVEPEMQEEWGQHPGFRPDGTEAKYVAKKCQDCAGEGCSNCHGRGVIYKVRRKTNVPPAHKGRVQNQPHHNRVTWPHNRDVKREPREEITPWNEHVRKPFMGKPHL